MTIIKNKKQLKGFLKFLKENNAYIQYRTNLQLKGFNHNNFFTIEMSRATKENLIASAFLWSDTKQGDAYWRKFSAQWLKVTKNYV